MPALRSNYMSYQRPIEPHVLGLEPTPPDGVSDFGVDDIQDQTVSMPPPPETIEHERLIGRRLQRASETGDNRALTWHGRFRAWLYRALALAPTQLADRAFSPARKREWDAITRQREAAFDRIVQDGRAALVRKSQAARESYAATARDCTASHEILLQRLNDDGRRLGKLMRRKMARGDLLHSPDSLLRGA